MQKCQSLNLLSLLPSDLPHFSRKNLPFFQSLFITLEKKSILMKLKFMGKGVRKSASTTTVKCLLCPFGPFIIDNETFHCVLFSHMHCKKSARKKKRVMNSHVRKVLCTVVVICLCAHWEPKQRHIYDYHQILTNFLHKNALNWLSVLSDVPQCSSGSTYRSGLERRDGKLKFL